MIADTIAIVGMGLIGGSYGLAIRDRSLACKVIGVSRRETTLSRARARGACDWTNTDLIAGCRDSDLVILCAPVSQIPRHAAALSGHLNDGTLVTDAGSTKREVVLRCEAALHPQAAFLGGHPMAGSEKSGVEHARADLFVGSTYVLTPTENTSPQVLLRVRTLAEALGARVLEMDAAVHDRCVAYTSHLPHCLAFALVQAVWECGADRDLLARLAAGSFHDATRVAASSPELWGDILATNREPLVKALDQFSSSLSELRQTLEAGDESTLTGIIDRANSRRASFVERRD